MALATPINVPSPVSKLRSTVAAVISRFPVLFQEPKVLLNDSSRNPPLPLNWIEKMKLKLPSSLICRVCAPSSWTAKYVPAIFLPRSPFSLAKVGLSHPEIRTVAEATKVRAAMDSQNLWYSQDPPLRWPSSQISAFHSARLFHHVRVYVYYIALLSSLSNRQRG